MKKYLLESFKIILIILFVALFITMFQYIGHEVIHKSEQLLNDHYLIVILTIITAAVGYIGIYLLNRLIPGYYGSGISQIEAYYRGWYSFSPYKMLVLIIINSFFAFFTGFLLGSEGPSISIGTSIARIGNDIFKSDDKEIEACGGSAGFGCAFMSPLAGLCHLIEENRHMLSISLLIKGFITISLSFILCYFLYDHSLLPYFEVDFLPFRYYLLLLLLIPICIAIGKLYIYLIVKVKDISKKYKIMIYLTPLLMILFMLLRRFYPILVGNGSLSLELGVLDYSLIVILLILLFRLIFTAISVSSNVSGGVVLPMLAVGALSAFVLVKTYSLLDSEILEYTPLFIICGMLGVFAVVTKAPLTSIVLGLKCAPIKVIILPLLLVISLSYLVVHIFKWENIYHQLEKRLPGYKH
ncbi:MAG: chloride channel protein [Acholeplasmatales bacterium]|nr:chloride channel protein [Acholeplasmatales bacterium]